MLSDAHDNSSPEPLRPCRCDGGLNFAPIPKINLIVMRFTIQPNIGCKLIGSGKVLNAHSLIMFTLISQIAPKTQIISLRALHSVRESIPGPGMGGLLEAY